MGFSKVTKEKEKLTVLTQCCSRNVNMWKIGEFEDLKIWR